jgi:hypothetical protein
MGTCLKIPGSIYLRMTTIKVAYQEYGCHSPPTGYIISIDLHSVLRQAGVIPWALGRARPVDRGLEVCGTYGRGAEYMFLCAMGLVNVI